MYKKILVANRGEIAVRVMRACRDMGIRTVAVYSEADRDGYHVQFADEAYPIGPAPATESYLNVSALIDVASRAQVDAIHPGYGFLSENAYFAAVCRTWGIDFIGPDPAAIQRMGDKAQARRLVKEAGVPVMPGSDGALEDMSQGREVAEKIGYPVLVKAAGGGGGRGIRVVEKPQDLEGALEAAAREAANSFGMAEVYVEKYIPNPRHVEVQILADSHGRTISLFERDSSIQRRRQKLIEESPSPFLDEELRWAMSEAAIQVAQVVRYKNAGTVEFLVDQDGSFYFIEMNTRLQVEHPVTEAVLGVDLVQEQIRIAMGQALSWRQEDLQPRGSAFEFRINAEDPYRGFIPSPGKVESLRWPMGPGVRVDEGIAAGLPIHPYYDSLMGKLIVWGADREEALRRAERALGELAVEGIRTTVPLYRELVRHPDFQRGTYHTRWLEEVFLARVAR